MAKRTTAGNGHLKNGQARIKSAREARRQKQSANSSRRLSRIFAVIGVIFAVLGCLFAIVYQYYYPKDDLIRMSVILRNHVSTALQAIEQKYKFDAYVLSDPLADVIKTKLRPVQERIASLKTQCAQYEKMEQIPGGPTKFIESSLHELNTDIEQRVTEVNTEALTILMDYVERGHAMIKAGIEMVNTGALRINNDHIKMLTMEGVYFIPIGDVPTEELDKARKELSLEQVISMVEELATLYEQLEEIGLSLGQLGKKIRFGQYLDAEERERASKNLSDEEYEKLMPYVSELVERRQKITEFKEKNSKYLQLFQELHSDQIRTLTTAMSQIRENDERRRKPYVNLHMAILHDIKNLKIRVDNLKYSYAKRKTTN